MRHWDSVGEKLGGKITPFAPSILSQLHVWVGMGILSRVRIVHNCTGYVNIQARLTTMKILILPVLYGHKA